MKKSGFWRSLAGKCLGGLVATAASTAAIAYLKHDTLLRKPGHIEGRLSAPAAEGDKIVLDDGSEKRRVFSLPAGAVSFRFDDVSSGRHTLFVRHLETTLNVVEIVVSGDSPALVRVEMHSSQPTWLTAPLRAWPDSTASTPPQQPEPSASSKHPAGNPQLTPGLRPSSSRKSPQGRRVAGSEIRSDRATTDPCRVAPAGGGESGHACATIDARAPETLTPEDGSLPRDYQNSERINAAERMCQAAQHGSKRIWNITMGIRPWVCECRD